MWNYEQNAQRVESEQQANIQRLLSNKAEQKQAKVKPFNNLTAKQIEVFNLVGASSFYFVENLLKTLPNRQQQEYFRSVYIKDYKSVKDDGSTSFHIGNKQRNYANTQLRAFFEKRLKLVLEQYNFNFEWLDDTLYSFKTFEIYQTVIQDKTKSKADVINNIFTPKGATALSNNKKPLPFFLFNERKLKEISKQLADAFSGFQYDFFRALQQRNLTTNNKKEFNEALRDCYKLCGEMCGFINFKIKGWDGFLKVEAKGKKYRLSTIQEAINKIACEEHWLKVLQTIQKRMVEHIAIACGEVQKNNSPYISREVFSKHKAKIKRSYDFLREMIIENIKDADEQVSLYDAFMSSISNPTNRRIEMMTRVRGVEEWSKEKGLTGLFITLTAPSKYHAQRASGGFNPKWNGAIPKDTNNYLNKVWRQIRALLEKNNIFVTGIRTVEPHHDGTPHWHLFIFVKAEHKGKVIEIFKQKALEEDGSERGAKEHRVTVKYEDESKGSFAGYVAKYIAKNIDGFTNEDLKSDEAQNIDLKENASRVRAWASLWGLRQFQFVRAGDVGVYRELRRIVEADIKTDESLKELLDYADKGEYKNYIEAQGGAMVRRKDQLARVTYAERKPNKYGEISKKTIGVKTLLEQVITRKKQWKLKKANKTKQETATALNTALQSETNNTGRSPAWTCVNNCNQEQNYYIFETKENYERQLKTLEKTDEKNRIFIKYLTPQGLSEIYSGREMEISQQNGLYLRFRRNFEGVCIGELELYQKDKEPLNREKILKAHATNKYFINQLDNEEISPNYPLMRGYWLRELCNKKRIPFGKGGYYLELTDNLEIKLTD